jgi:hypothetical protein
MYKYDALPNEQDLQMNSSPNDNDTPSDAPELIDHPTEDVSTVHIIIPNSLNTPRFLDNFSYMFFNFDICVQKEKYTRYFTP